MKIIEPIDADLIESSTTLFSQGEIKLEQWQEITRQQYSKNSLLSFQNDWQTFVEYCLVNHLSPLPAAEKTVRTFIEEKAQTRKAASLKRYVITISLLHKLHRHPDPTRHREIRFLLNKLYQAKADDAEQANGFHESHLQQLTTMFRQSKKPKDIRDLLIWTLCFEAMLKRSELAALPYNAILKKEGKFYLYIDEYQIELSEQAGLINQQWLSLSGINEGALLRRINKHHQIGEKPMDHSSIYRVFRRAATELGQTSLTFSGQSPRVGASQDLSQSGKSIKEIQQQGRWKSPAMPAQYVGNKQARDEAMARFKRKIEKD